MNKIKLTSISDIINSKSISDIDGMELHKLLHDKIESGAAASYFEALTDYITDNNIDIDDIVKIINPGLLSQLKYECAEAKLINVEKGVSIEQFI